MTSPLSFTSCPLADSWRTFHFYCVPIKLHKFKLILAELIIFIDKTTVSHALTARHLVLLLQLLFEPPMAATAPSPPDRKSVV